MPKDDYDEVVEEFLDCLAVFGEDDDIEIERVFLFAEHRGLSFKEAQEAYREARKDYL